MDRYVSVSLLTGKAFLTMWYGTEDEETFPIKGIKTKPYVLAYGTRYDLTDEEIESLRFQLGESNKFREWEKNNESK